MDQSQTRALFLQGKAEWNKWANRLLAIRKKLEETGRWETRRDRWHESAEALFSSHQEPWTCDDIIRFDGFLFPGNADFSNATFKEGANFSDAKFDGTADFSNATFIRGALFSKATFKEGADFSNATFEGGAFFNDAKFEGTADFSKATFKEGAGFINANFEKWAGFSAATFEGSALFTDAKFGNDAVFSDATFEGGALFTKAKFGNDAKFRGIKFEKRVSFERAIFENSVSFEGMQPRASFSLHRATFGVVPDFDGVHFEEAPRLDQMIIRRSAPTDENTAAYFRTLKLLAEKGKDHESELEFFARELRSARGFRHFPLPYGLTWAEWRELPKQIAHHGTHGQREGEISEEPRISIAAWYLSCLYGCFSDYGRSVIRPLAGLIFIFFLFAGLYLFLSPAAWTTCYGHVDVRAIHSIEGDKTVIDFTGLTEPAREQTSARVEALHLSVHNMSLVLDVGADSLNRSYGCLYGIERYGDNPLVYVPPSVSFLSGIQKILSLILVFLIGLALRNTLRMR